MEETWRDKDEKGRRTGGEEEEEEEKERWRSKKDRSGVGMGQYPSQYPKENVLSSRL